MRGLLLFILIPALKQAFKEEEFRDIIIEAISEALKGSVLVQSLTSKANKYIGLANQKYDSLGPMGFYLKGYVLSKVEEFGESNETIDRALTALGEPYIRAVLDGIDPEELAQVTQPVMDVLFNKALSTADLLINPSRN